MPGDLGHGLHTRSQHAKAGDRTGVEQIGRRAGERPAGHKNGLDVEAGHEVQVLLPHPAELLLRAAAVGHAPGIAEKDQILLRQQRAQGHQACKPAQAGVNYSDRSCIHSCAPYIQTTKYTLNARR